MVKLADAWHRSLMVWWVFEVGGVTCRMDKNYNYSIAQTVEHLRRNEQKYQLCRAILSRSSCVFLFPAGQWKLAAATPAISTPKGKPIFFALAALCSRESPLRQFWKEYCIVSIAFQFFTPGHSFNNTVCNVFLLSSHAVCHSSLWDRYLAWKYQWSFGNWKKRAWEGLYCV